MDYKPKAVTVEREGIINEIRTNLDAKRYGNKFCITQELIQNADDAKAERLLIGYGLLPSTTSLHPLLKEDGIFFVNDGKLTADDLNHLFKVATSNKSSDKDKIGHFGLGMKSVFHLCEAFFLFFEQPENRSQFDADVMFLDPWYDNVEPEVTPPSRINWQDEYTAHGDAISKVVHAYLAPWVKDWPRWFCVWLPLRKRWMNSEACPPIKTGCWSRTDVEELFSESLSPVIAEMLPFLKHLRQISLIDAMENNVIDTISVFAERRLQMKSGTIDMRLEHRSESIPSVQVIGNEKLFEQDQFKDMMDDPDWPLSAKCDKNGNFLKEKVTPHAALFWGKSEVDHGMTTSFSVKHCVFLPLTSDKQKCIIPIDLPFNLALCFHATLFVDAGRQDFTASNDENASIQNRWNARLLSNGLLPMVIPSFEREVSAWENQQHITKVVGAINNYLDKHDEEQLELNYRNSITRQYQFLNCLTPEGWKWRKVPISKEFLCIPETHDKALQKVLMEKLAIQDLLLVQNETPGITIKRSVDLDDSTFRRLRLAIDNLHEIHRSSIPFVSWLDKLMSLYPMDASRQHELLRLLLENISMDAYKKLQSDIYRLMRHFSNVTQKVYLARTNWNEDTFKLWKQMALNEDVQVSPMLFSYTENERPDVKNEVGESIKICEYENISTGDLEILFKQMAGRMTKAAEDDERRALFKNIIFTYLNHCPSAEHSEKIRELKLFAFIDQKKEWQFLPLSKILDSSQPIFLNGGETTLIPRIAQAADIEYFRFQETDSFYTDLMEKRFKLHRFSFREDLNRFFPEENLLKLHSVHDRFDLFKTLINSGNLSDFNKIVRYLLHGDAKRFSDDSELFILPNEGAKESKAIDFWDNLLKLFFEKTNSKQSKLPDELTKLLVRDAERTLNITPLTHDEILRRLEKVDWGNEIPFQMNNINNSTWKYLIGDFTHSDRICCQVAMSLPVYPMGGGKFAALNDIVYFDYGKCKVPDIALSHYNRCEIPADKLLDLYETTSKNVPYWSYAETLKFCIEYGNEFSAEELSPVIEDALKAIIRQNPDEKLDEAILGYLKQQPFIRCKNGKLASPYRILNLTCGEDEVKDIISQCGIFLYDDVLMEEEEEEALQKTWTKKAWRWLEEHLLPQIVEYGKILGEALSQFDCYCIGRLSIDDDLTKKLIASPVIEKLLPAISFVKKLRFESEDDLSTSIIMVDYLSFLSKDKQIEWLLQTCNHLLEQESKKPSRLYLEYLQVLTKCKDFNNQILSLLKLPNEKGQICHAEKLVHSGNGISPSQLLHHACRDFFPDDEQKAKTVCAQVPHFSDTHNLTLDEWEAKVASTRQDVENYFVGWDDDLKYHIATLIVLCDDSKEMQKYVKQHLWDKGDADNLRGQVSYWDSKKYKDCRLCVKVYETNTLEMKNLLGQNIKATLAKTDEMDSLLVGSTSYSCVYNCSPRKSIYLALRHLTEDDRTEIGNVKLMKLLERTIQILVEKLTGFSTSADSILDYIKKSELLDLEIVREIILEGLHSYLPSLGIRKSNLNSILDEWHELHKNKIQAIQSKTQEKNEEKQEHIDELENKIQKKVDELRIAVSEDKNIQMDIINAVITRITEHCGYDLESIPFELFQNADDAVKEMEIAVKDLSPYQRMVVKLTDTALTILHFGRPINKSVSSTDDDENARGCQDDLEKMLQLWRSDKEVGELKRTGKFGLGFKSVYQLTDEPLVSSAHLRFRIKGTLFPMYATPEERKLLEQLSAELKNDAELPVPLPPETLIHLPIRKGIDVYGYGEKCMTDGLTMRLDSFFDSADLLVIFSNAIRQLDIIDKSRHYTFIAQKKKTFNGFDIINTSPGHDFGVIHLQKSGIDIALGYDINKRKFMRLDEKIATVWITEPTKEHNDLGFAVNGNFAVDIGRNNLMMTNKHNEDMANEAGHELYRFLKEHYDGFSEDLLSSLWECFTGGKNSGQWRVRSKVGVGTYLPNIFWGTRENLHGYGKFLMEFPAVPTYLNNGLPKFMKLGNCKYSCEERLTEPCNWKLFKPFSSKQLEHVISRRTVEVLENILYIHCEEITGFQILKTWFEKQSILSPELLNGKQWHDIIDYCKSDERLLASIVSNHHFYSQRNTSVLARDLISHKSSHSEEIDMLLDFADDTSILSDEYDDEAHMLFELAECLHENRISVLKIVEWVKNAESDEAINAVCRYLVKGKQSYELAQILEPEKDLPVEIIDAVKHRLGVFAKNVSVDSDEDTSSSNDSSEHFQKLQNIGIITNEADAPDEGPEKAKSMTPKDLEWLIKNWPLYKSTILQKYNKDVYDRDSEYLLKLPVQMEDDDLESRQKWMEFFILAMSRKIGRQKDVQHRGFVQKCRQLGWMEVFAAPDEPIEKKSEKWIRLLDNAFNKYNGAPEEYSHWMQLYPWIYQINKFLMKYISLLDRFNRDGFVPKKAEDIFQPSSSSYWDGANMNVPPLRYALGHIGPHWLLRELIRSGTITNKALHRFCYVPCTQVKRLFGKEMDGMKSEEIFEKVNGNTFDLSFDIAFKALDRK